jgi:hypothetical protein
MCVIGTSPHRADEGYLCLRHLQRFADVLRDIEDEASLLDARPSMQVVAGRSGSLKSERAPAVLDVIVANDPRRGAVDYSDPWALDDTASVLGTLHDWARVVREERQLSPAEQITITGERDCLTRNLNWIAAQPWCDDALDELTALLGQLQNTNHTAAAKPLARCHLSADEGQCGGAIRVNWEDGYAHCGKCRATWTGEELAALNARIEDLARPRTHDGRVMMTVAQIVARFGGNANAVRVRLSRAGIKGVDGYYDTAVFERVSA